MKNMTATAKHMHRTYSPALMNKQSFAFTCAYKIRNGNCRVKWIEAKR